MPLLASLFPAFSFSWWNGGHEIVGRIAERMITADQSSYLTNLFAQWPGEQGNIVNISTWQDILKESKISIMASWHFVDTPVIAPGYTPIPSNIERTYNVSCVIRDCVNSILEPTTTSEWSISFCIRSLLHFVGDTHQPLHASEYYSAEFPSGDRGGNSIHIHCGYGDPCNNLHAMWDSALLMYQFDQSTDDPSAFEANVTNIVTNFPAQAQSPQADSIDPFVMSDEAHNISVGWAYGKLDWDTLNVDDTYMVPNRGQANRLLSLGGYRLGLILQKFFARGFVGPVEKSGKKFPVREAIAWGVDGLLAVTCGACAVLFFRGKRQYRMMP
jgi:hypothetical protein